MKLIKFLVIITLWILAQYSVPTIFSQSSDKENISIEIWHPYSGEQQIKFDDLVEVFNTTNRLNITVESRSLTNRNLLYDQVIINLTPPTNFDLLPNLIIVFPDEAVLFSLGGDILDLTPFIADSEISDLLPHIHTIGYVTQDNQQVGFPLGLQTELMYINLSALYELDAEVPQTTQQFADIACQFRENSGWRDGQFGVVWGSEIVINGSLPRAWLQNVESDASLTFNLTPNIGMIQTIQQAHAAGCIISTNDRSIALDTFASGRSLFYLGSSSELKIMQDSISLNYVNPFEWGVYLLPDTYAPYIYGTVASVVNYKDDENAASWAFIEWLLDNENYADYLAITEELPIDMVTADVINVDFLQWQQVWQLIEANADSLIYEPTMAGGDVIRLEVAFAWQRMLQHGTDIPLELSTLDARLTEVIDNFQ